MFDGLLLLGQGIGHFLTPASLFNVAWATLLGVVIGILPGLTATMGVALLVTLTYKMAPDQAILTLMCVYLGAIYGGSRTAILLARYDRVFPLRLPTDSPFATPPFAADQPMEPAIILSGTDPDLPATLLDVEQIKRVFVNLIDNALHALAAASDQRLITISTSRDVENGVVRAEIADTGKGIEPDFLPRVFTAFSQADATLTRSFGGLGLGLAISKELVELHGGIITAYSAGLDQGATFTVKLPAAGCDKAARRRNSGIAVKQTEDALIEGMRILLVEDEPNTRDALQRLLGKNGAQVLSVANAADALKSFSESRPDIIISDIGLPEEDGYSLLQRIRSLEMEQEQPPTPAIALTAFAGRKDRHMAREAGFHKHIAKPVSPAVLLAAISTLLADKERAQDR